MTSDEDFEQTTFRDGRVIREPPDRGRRNDADLVHPNEESGILVAIKSNALEVNQQLVDVRDEHGDVLSFASREKAETFAAQLSSESGTLMVQAAAPNDTDDVDAYLLAEHKPAARGPARVDGDTLTFDVGANLYGSLGESVILSGSTSPAIEYFVENDLEEGRFADGPQVEVTNGELVSFDDHEGESKRWMPDCCVVVRDGWRGRLVEQYWCEIKTGAASFERTQVAAMRELAKDERVLKLRVSIDALPTQYSVRIDEVGPVE